MVTTSDVEIHSKQRKTSNKILLGCYQTFGVIGLLAALFSSLYLSGWSGGALNFETTLNSVVIFLLIQSYCAIINFYFHNYNDYLLLTFRYFPFILLILFHMTIKRDPTWLFGALIFVSIIGWGKIAVQIISPKSNNQFLAFLPVGQLCIATIFLTLNQIVSVRQTSIFILVVGIVVNFGQIIFKSISRRDNVKSPSLEFRADIDFMKIALSISPATLGILFLLVIVSFSPILGYDSLAMKIWLPSQWLSQDAIFLPTAHLLSGVSGSFSFPVLMGAVLGTVGVGNCIQLLSLACVAGVVSFFLNNSQKLPGRSSDFLPILFIGIPAYSWQVANSYDDLWLMAVLSLGILFIQSNKANYKTRHLALVSIVLGGVSTAKFSLLPTAAIVLAVYLLQVLMKIEQPLRRCLATITCIGTFCLSLLPFYGWKWINYGNPFWPLLNGIFHAKDLPPSNITFNLPYFKINFFETFLSPISTIIQPNKWGEEGAPGSYSGMFGLIIIAAIAAIVVIIHERRVAIHIPAVTVCIFMIFWIFSFRYSRYLIFIFPLAIITLNELISTYQTSKRYAWQKIRNIPLILGYISAAALTIGNPALPERIPYKYFMNSTSQENYLYENNSDYRLIEFINRTLPKGSSIMSASLYQRLWLRTDITLYHHWEISPEKANYVWRLVSRADSPSIENKPPFCQSNREFETWTLIAPQCEFVENK
jgi:hypothetical protein